MLAVKGVGEGVEVRTGVWSDSDSAATAAEDDAADLLGMVIFGFGFSIFICSLVEGLTKLVSSGSSLMPPKVDTDGRSSDSESESSLLQMGR